MSEKEYIDREKLAGGLKEWQNRLIEIYGENDEYTFQNFCPNCGADMRPTSMSGANGEES